MKKYIEINEDKKGDIVILRINGEIDANSIQEINDKITNHINIGVIKFILDFSNVKFINSSGVDVIILKLVQLKRTGGDLKLISVSKNVKEILELLDAMPQLSIYDDEDSAIKSFQI